MTTIAERTTYINNRISHWEGMLTQIQDECDHKNASREYKGSSGNYDPSADCYWIEFKCPDCEKWWQENQ